MKSRIRGIWEVYYKRQECHSSAEGLGRKFRSTTFLLRNATRATGGSLLAGMSCLVALTMTY